MPSNGIFLRLTAVRDINQGQDQKNQQTIQPARSPRLEPPKFPKRPLTPRLFPKALPFPRIARWSSLILVNGRTHLGLWSKATRKQFRPRPNRPSIIHTHYGLNDISAHGGARWPFRNNEENRIPAPRSRLFLSFHHCSPRSISSTHTHTPSPPSSSAEKWHLTTAISTAL